MPDVNINDGRLSQNKLRDILQTTKVDVGNGTLFGVGENSRRAPQKDRLTLVISTGGSGKSSIQEAMRIAEQKLEEEYKTYVKFIVVDSSTGELAPFEKMEKRVIKTLNTSALGAKDRFKHEKRDPFFKEIMPEDYDVAGLLSENGASQDRMTGRIKLYDKFEGEGNDTRLKRIIKNLFTTEWLAHKNKPVDIIILSGISGGNGSGTFLDLAVMAKSACPDQSRVKVYGYLMLPDTAEQFASGDQAKGSLYRNGFAALKELESYMSLFFEPERKEIFPSTVVGEEVEVSSQNLPFDYPVLISGNYDDAVSMIAETIINLIADNGGLFDQKAFYCNLIPMRNNALAGIALNNLGVLQSGVCPEDSHMYCGIGYAHASVPEKIVIPNIVGKVCKKLYVSENDMGLSTDTASEAFCNEQKPLTTVQFEHAMRILFALEGELTSRSLWNKIMGILEQYGRLEENEFGVTKADIMADNVQEYLDGFHVTTRASEATEAMIEELKRLQDEFKSNAKKVMTLYGPRAMQFLYEGKGYFTANGGREDLSNISIQTMIDTVQLGLQKLASAPGQYPPRVERKGLIKEIIDFFTHGDANSWMGQAADAAQQDVFCQVAKRLGGGTWKQEYENRIVSFLASCIRFADVLDVMTDHYEGTGKVLDEGYEKFSAETGEKNGINLCQNQKMYDWVKEKVDQKIAGVNMTTVKSAMINDFMVYREEWVSEDKGKARKRYDEVMSRSCSLGKYAAVGEGLHLSVADYFDEVLKDITDVSMQVTVIQNELVEIIGSLRQASAPSLNIERNDGIHINENLLVPKNVFSGPMGALIQKTLGDIVGDPKKIHQSSATNAIVCYQTSVANPISGLKDLRRWEKAYEDNFGTEKSSTCHSCNGEHVTQYTELTGTATDRERGNQLLDSAVDAEHDKFASTGLSWKHYPSINTRSYENEFQNEVIDGIGKTSESGYRKTVFDPKIEYALREGIIECEREGNKYTYYINLIPKDWNNLSAANYTADELALEKGKFKRGKHLFEHLAVQNPHSEQVWRKQIKLLGSKFFEEPFDFSAILAKEHWKPERVNATHKAYMKRIMRKNIYLYRQLEETLYRYDGIRRTLEEGEVQYKEQYQLSLFLDLFLYGLIYSDARGQVWNVQINEMRANKPIVEFNMRLSAMLKGMESGIHKDKLSFALVYERFVKMTEKEEINLDELDLLKDEVINNMQEEEFIQIKEQNLARLLEYDNVYQEKYGVQKDPEKAMADAWNLRGTERLGVSRVAKLYWAIEQLLEENGEKLESKGEETERNRKTESEVIQPEKEQGWICPVCRTKHADNVKFCPNDGTPQPPQGWICPVCGTKHADNVKFCPNDGTQKPVKEQGWICPKCGAKHEDSVRFCPNDGMQKPE